MSADNAVLILCLKDQFRVTEASAIDNLYWNWSDNPHSGKLVSARVFEYFKSAKQCKTKEEAFSIATTLYEKSDYVEYGIVPLEMKRTWSQLLKDGRDELASEKMFVINKPDLKNKSEVLEEINYLYSDILSAINKEKYAK